MDDQRQLAERYTDQEPIGPERPARVFSARSATDGRPVILKSLLVPPEDRGAHAIVGIRADNIVRHCAPPATGLRLTPEEYGYLVATDQFGELSLAELFAGLGLGEAGLPMSQALALAAALAAALQAVHAHTYHGNLKPSNVRLATAATPAGYQLRLTDFALLPVEHDPPLDRASLTYTWTPERVRGELTPDGHMGATEAVERGRMGDLYALGKLLHQLFAGAPPMLIESRAQLTSRLLYDVPPPLLELRPDLDTALAAAVDACLRGDPARRPAVGELVAALGAACAAYELRVGRRVFAAPAAPAAAGKRVPAIVCSDQRRPDEPEVIVPLTGAGLTLGSGHEWEQTFEARSIADSEVIADWDGIAVTFTVARSTGAIVFRGQPVPGHAPVVWPWNEALVIGPYELKVLPPDGGLTPAPAPDLPPPPPPPVAPAPAPSVGLLMALTLTQTFVRPGEPLSAALTITNGGPSVEHVTLAVETRDASPTTGAGALPAVEPGWVHGLDGLVELYTDQQIVRPLLIEVPALPTSAAGRYSLAIRGTSRARRGEFARAEAELEVRPFYGAALEIKPKRRRGVRQGRYTLTVRNLGNTPATFRVSGEDDAYALKFDLGEPSLELPPGHRESRPLVVKPTGWHLIGPSEQHLFQVQAVAAKGAVAQGGARFDRLPLVPAWLAGLLPLLLIAVCALIYLTRPLAPLDGPLLGQPLYGVLRPPPTATPTPTVTATPPLLEVALPPPTATATPPPTAWPTLAPTATLTPTETPTLTPSLTPTDTPVPTATPAPMPDGALAYCPRGVPIMIEAATERNGAFLLRFHDYIASMGQLGAPNRPMLADGAGRILVPLIIGDGESPGVYRVQVETQRGSPLRTFYCRVLPPGVAPTPTPQPSPTATPTPSLTPTPTPTPDPSATGPTVTPSLTPPPTATPPPPPPTATPRPVPDGDYVARCAPGTSVLVEGQAEPGVNYQLYWNGSPLYPDQVQVAGADGLISVALPIDGSVRGGIYPVALVALDGRVLRSFYCDTFGQAPPGEQGEGQAPDSTAAPPAEPIPAEPPPPGDQTAPRGERGGGPAPDPVAAPRPAPVPAEPTPP